MRSTPDLEASGEQLVLDLLVTRQTLETTSFANLVIFFSLPLRLLMAHDSCKHWI